MKDREERDEDMEETPDVQEEISKAIDEKLAPVVKSVDRRSALL